MNLLVLVMAMLMTLAIVTSARLQEFLPLAKVRMEYRHHMLNAERWTISDRAAARYRRPSPTGDPAKTVPDEPSEDEDGDEEGNLSRFLNVRGLVDETARQRDAFPLAYELLKELIFLLYHEEDFFVEAQESHPSVVDDLLHAVQDAAASPEKKGTITTNKKLADVVLGDETLNLPFRKMLKGSRRIDEPPDAGYPPLTAFITVVKSDKLVSVYLAAPELLLALFGDADVVRDIRQTRQTLHKAVNRKKDPLSKEQATSQFVEQFGNNRYLLDETLVDFRVSTTKP